MIPRTLRRLVLLPLLLLGACSRPAAEADAPKASDAARVATAMPRRSVFRQHVEAFGTFAGDNRHAQTLTLPQPGQVIAAEVTPGRRVDKGQALLRLATDPSVRNAYQQARTALDLARGELDRNQRLAGEHLATNAQLAAARKALADAQTGLAAQGRLGGANEVAVLAAPADGVVTAVAVAVGEHVPAGARLIDFTPRRALSAQLGVAPEQAARIRAGMPVEIAPVYGPDGPAMAAHVGAVAGAVNPQTHLVDVLADLDAGESTPLAAGAALHAQIEIAQRTAWAVPRASLLGDDGGGSHLFQIHQGKAHRIDVEVVASEGDPVGVDGALDAADPVVTLGAYELADGDAVQPQADARTPP